MAMYKPSELRLFLNELGIFPKKGLSQNFLIDGNIIRKIVQAAQVKPGDVVLEIGPGPGSLTQLLLEAGAHVIAVEKDTVLASALQRFKTDSNQLQVFCQDIPFHRLEKRTVKLTGQLQKPLPVPPTLPLTCLSSPSRRQGDHRRGSSGAV